MINIERGKLNKINRRETLHYLGLRACDVPPEETEAVIDECEKLALDNQDLKAVWSVYDIKADGDNLDLGFAEVKSHALSLNLRGCKKIVLFASTVGAGIDRLIVRYKRISPARAAVLQAIGATMAEEWCDMLCERLGGIYPLNKARFSCGFGDLPLTLQRDIFAALNVTKRIGITLSDDCFMTPTKSVTAIVGIKEQI